MPTASSYRTPLSRRACSASAARSFMASQLSMTCGSVTAMSRCWTPADVVARQSWSSLSVMVASFSSRGMYGRSARRDRVRSRPCMTIARCRSRRHGTLVPGPGNVPAPESSHGARRADADVVGQAVLGEAADGDAEPLDDVGRRQAAGCRGERVRDARDAEAIPAGPSGVFEAVRVQQHAVARTQLDGVARASDVLADTEGHAGHGAVEGPAAVEQMWRQMTGDRKSVVEG